MVARVERGEENWLAAGLLVVTGAWVMLEGLEMVLVPVVLHRHLWNQLAGLQRLRRGREIDTQKERKW